MYLSILLSCILAGILFPASASAQVSTLPSLITNLGTVGGLWTTNPPSLTACAAIFGGGACTLANSFVYAVQQGRFLIGGVGFLVIVVAAYRLIISQSEEALTTARRTIFATATGLFLIFLAEPLVESLYGGFGAVPEGQVLQNSGNIATATGVMQVELLGIVSWLETLVAMVAIGLMIVQAVTVLGSFGSEETARKAYRAVLYSIGGILLVIFDRAVASIFGYATIGTLPGTPTTLPFFVEVFGLIRFLLVFVGIIVVGVIIYAGFLMLFNYGNDELVSRAKTTLTNAIIGLVLIVMAFVLVSTVILGIS